MQSFFVFGGSRGGFIDLGFFFLNGARVTKFPFSTSPGEAREKKGTCSQKRKTKNNQVPGCQM